MIAEMEYASRSAIVNGMRQAHVYFATNQKREPTYFRGKLAQPVLFREALAALHHVVVSDYKYRPKDRLAFRAWLEEQDRKFLADLGIKGKKAQQRIEQLEERLLDLNKLRDNRLKPFYKARQMYFDFVYANEYEMEMIFDPVITVHPDEVSFEAFSRDESTYARVAAKYEMFDNVDEFQCGTTNIDFSTGLHGEMERMRTYRSTQFDIAPSGFSLSHDDVPTLEKKIDLPESWVMGFLQVHSTMTLGLRRFHMAPIDLYNICRHLRRHKARKSPRSLRYELVPGEPIKAILEPWNHEIELTALCPMDGGKPLTMDMTPGALYAGDKAVSIRTWGRDRLQTVARLLPLCKRVDVFLAGTGLPSVYVLDLGSLTFTLALSGWTDNDWTGGGTQFDLLTRPMDVSSDDLMKTYDALSTEHYATDGTLASMTGYSIEQTRSALSHLCQIGRAMYDLAGGVYRKRELFATPFTLDEALKAVKKVTPKTQPQQASAQAIHQKADVRITARRPVSTGFKLTGSAKGGDGARVRPLLHVDHDGQIIEAECTCKYFKKFQLTKGPCEHILALRLAHMDKMS